MSRYTRAWKSRALALKTVFWSAFASASRRKRLSGGLQSRLWQPY
jgi:hypothetical protein